MLKKNLAHDLAQVCACCTCGVSCLVPSEDNLNRLPETSMQLPHSPVSPCTRLVSFLSTSPISGPHLIKYPPLPQTFKTKVKSDLFLCFQNTKHILAYSRVSMHAYWCGLNMDSKLGVPLPNRDSEKKKILPICSLIPQRLGEGGLRDPELCFKLASLSMMRGNLAMPRVCSG